MKNKSVTEEEVFGTNETPFPIKELRIHSSFSIGEWFVIVLLGCIPIVQIVFAMKWASGNTKHKVLISFGKALLLLYLLLATGISCFLFI